MFKNYFKTAIRNLLRYKGFATINILSLAIGITGCLAIALFVYDERVFDKNIPGGENVYRVYEERTDNNVKSKAAISPPMFATFLKNQYPEVEQTARILMSNDKFLLEAADKKGYEEKGWIVDSTFFQVFPLPFLSGNGATALNEPSTIVISEDIAKRYFGTVDAAGKSIKINNSPLTVKGVFAKLPEHFHLAFQYLMPMSAAGLPKERMERWTWHQFYTYIKLRPGSDAQNLESKFQAYVKKDIFPTLTQAGSTFLPLVQPLKDIHLHSADFVYDNAVRGNATSVKALTIIALFVLVIACFNFINLATARSFRRAKEIGVRKVVGAERSQLVVQFISETVLLSLVSMLLAIIAMFFILPWLNSFTGKHISFNPITHPLLALALLLASLVLGVLAGLYPAMILSGFQPIKVLKNMKLATGSTPWLRHALVVVQFALSVLLIVCTLVVYRQTNFLNNKDLGFSKEQVLYFQVRDSLASNPKTLETFKDEIRNTPNVLSVTSGYGLPGDQFAGDGVSLQTKEGEKEFPANVFIGDYDYAKTLGLKIIAGRDFSRQMATDEREAFLVNETAVKEWGFGTPEKAIGQPIAWHEWEPKDTLHPMKRGKVVGVVQDFHYKSLHEKVTPSVIQIYPAVTYKVAVKLQTADIKNTLASINRIWNNFSPAYPLDYKFMDETYGTMYKSEEKLSSLIWIFTIMAIVVGCMGLFALAAFNAEQRTKEIGIRKVLGAGTFNIFGLLSKSFVRLVAISSLLAFPVAWWAMNKWLEDFSYRINIGWWVFLVAGAAALLIALLTISFQAVKAAVANPVKSLRTE